MNDDNNVNSKDSNSSINAKVININYNSLFNNKHIIMLTIDSDTTEIVDANPAACSFYGYSHSDLTKMLISNLNTLTKQEIDVEISLSRTQQKNHFFFQHRLCSGEIRNVEVQSGPVNIMGRELIYSIVNDITEQKKVINGLVEFNNELEKIVEEKTSALEEINAQLEEEISEHLNTEENLKKSLLEIEDLYNNVPCGYHSLDEDGTFVRINDTQLKWLGYKREEIIGKKTFSEVLTPDSLNTFLGTYSNFKINGYVKDLEFDLIRSDGTILTVLLSATANMDNNGNYIMSRSTCYDITEHRKIKDALRDLNSSLESIVIERTNQLQDINAELEESNALLEESNAMLEEEISERENIGMALKRSEELYRSVYDNSPLAFSIWDREYKIIDWNRRAEELFGWSKSEVIGKRFVDFLVPQKINAAISMVALDILNSSIPSITFNENITKDGGILLCEWHNSLLHDDWGNLIGAISVGLDKTDTIKAEKEIVQAKEQLEGVNYELSTINISLKNEIAERIKIEEALLEAKIDAEQANTAKSQFLANMSHEIRTPMNGIIGMTDITLMTELKGEQREYLNIVKSSTTLLLRILNDILDYSKIEAGKMNLESEPFDIRETIKEVIDLFIVAANQKQLFIKLSIDSKIPHKIIGDSIRLRQILSNLVGNSVKFTLMGGVSINIILVKKQARRVLLKFIVSDTGIGIPEDKIDKLFKRFSQVDDSINKKFGGTGLGLAISKKLIEMMDGEMGMESTESIGSDFFFTTYFGIDEDYTTVISEESSIFDYLPIEKESKKKILLVEDDDVSRNIAEILLKKKNYQVVLAKNGREAVDIFEKEIFDLILMDINMPYLDGYSATALIRLKEQATAVQTPIIAMTAYALSGDRDKCIKAGMDDYISKPIDFNELFRVVDIWLDK